MYATQVPVIPIGSTRAARILLTGTLAIDHVANYPGVFSGLPRHRGINLAIQLGAIERRFGGCAMNIAYNLRLLGDAPAPFLYVGQDFNNEYAGHLAEAGIDASGIRVVDAPHSAHAFIFTDRDNNQFTGFYGGPGPDEDFEANLKRYAAGFDYGILAPDLPGNMIMAARAMRDIGVPFLTDPGPNVTDFPCADAIELLRLSTSVIVNEYEYTTLRGLGVCRIWRDSGNSDGVIGRLGLGQRASPGAAAGFVALADDALESLELLVVTEGERGVRWQSNSQPSGHVNAVTARIVDPTGCGDAFRGGFVHARLRGACLAESARAGAVLAAIVLEASGTQTHGGDGFAERYRQAWSDIPDWLGNPPEG